MKRFSVFLPSLKLSHSSTAPPPSFPPPTDATDEPQVPDPRVFTVTSLSRLECNGNSLLPTISQCAVHLCLLEAFWRLKQQVTIEHAASFDTIFGYSGGSAKAWRDREVENGSEAGRDEQEKERWWKAFVELAVERFEVWWIGVEEALRKREDKKNTNEFDKKRETETNVSINPNSNEPIQLHRLPPDMLPPLDVLMIWHSYMLNPKYYYEDCLRHDMYMMLELEFPWAEIHSAINTSTWEYTLSASSISFFTSLPHPRPQAAVLITQLKPSMTNHPTYPHPQKTITCPNCHCTDDVPVTNPIECNGYVDEKFNYRCLKCNLNIDRTILGSAKFLEDINLLLTSGKWLRGTRIDGNGNDAFSENPQPNLTNAFFKQAFEGFGELNFQKFPGWEAITKHVENAIQSLPGESSPPRDYERCMALYHTPHPIFSLDLVAAVGRQGGFIEKMEHHLWIRSPGLCGRLDASVLQNVRETPGACVYVDETNTMGTIERAIERYKCFFELFRRYPGRTMVPTLDIDVVWHSQQLSPMLYKQWCKEAAERYIDHDDKLGEDVLEDGFGNTRKLWRKEFQEEYGRCICWFCEVVLNNYECGLTERRRSIWRKWKKESNTKVRLRVEFHREVEKRRRKGEEGVGREGLFNLLERYK